jgi:hypothetical protein
MIIRILNYPRQITRALRLTSTGQRRHSLSRRVGLEATGSFVVVRDRQLDVHENEVGPVPAGQVPASPRLEPNIEVARLGIVRLKRSAPLRLNDH